MSAARERILGRLRANTRNAPALPDLQGDWIRFGDPVSAFVANLEAAGGVAQVVETEDLIDGLSETARHHKARRVGSAVPQFRGDVAWAEVPGPHSLSDLDLMVAPGRFAVAENGAVWVDGGDVPVRAALFLAQHLVLVVPVGEIVAHMHSAYDRLTFDGPGDSSGFGCFISGPSKTADIEQALVIGAHGPRSATVLLTR